MDARLRVEFHCHTIHSKDSLTEPQKLVSTCREKGIERVVVTDHNTIRGALEAQSIDPELVIIGEEIMTVQGELLAAYVEEEIPAGLEADEAIARLRDQGAFISVSHPFDRIRSGHWNLADLEGIAPLVDAIEVFNARCISNSFNQRAEKFAQDNHLSGTAGSDAHSAYELGTAIMDLPIFQDAASLQAALRDVRYEVSLSPIWVRLFSRYAVIRKWIVSTTQGWELG